MFDEQWQFAVEVEREYAQYRKKVMMRYHLSAAEVDILLFLANNSQFDLATDIVRVRKMQKSHVSLAVNGLCEKGYLRKEGDMLRQSAFVTDRNVRRNLENLCFAEFQRKIKKNFCGSVS